METKVAVSGNSGRGAYIFVVAVVGIMLIVSTMVGVIRLKETVFAHSQGQAAAAVGAAKAAADDSIAAFYARPYRGAAQPVASESDVKAATDDSIAAFYARPYRGAAQPAAGESDVKTATDDSIAAFYAARYYQAAVRQAAAVAAGR